MKASMRRRVWRGSRWVVGPALIGVALGARGTVLVVSAVRVRLAPVVEFPRRGAAWALDVLVGTAVDAVLDRVDLVGTAEDVVAAIDLPEIVRRSTGAVASDFVHQARMRGAGADDAMARVRNRLSGRDRRDQPGTP